MNFYLVPENGNPEKLVKIGNTQPPANGILIPRHLWNEDEADLLVSYTTDEEGFEQVTITLDEKAKSQRISRESQDREAREQKESQRRQRKDQEVQKLLSREAATLSDALEQLEALKKIILADKGVIDLAEEAVSPGDDKGKEREP